MTTEQVLVEVAGDLATVTLNRPDRRNALSESMLRDLGAGLARAVAAPAVRAIIVAANGPVFSSGHDFADMADRDVDAMRRLLGVCTEVMLGLARLPVPVVACVQGIATAAGCQLVASCDLAVASEAAAFATPGVNIGLFCSTPMVALSRNVPRKHAMEMLLTGDLVPAEEARRIGLVNRVVAPGSERTEALALARQIASKSALTVKIGKEAFYRQLELNLADAYRYTAEVMVENMLARDAEEGIGAFIEKRAPRWEDR